MAGPNMKPVIIEMWTEYAIGILVLLLRVFTRCKVIVGFHWQYDDFLAVAAIILFTLEVMMCQIIANKGSITGMTDEIALNLTKEQYESHETGAKWLFSAWYIYVSLIWSLKGILLFFFARITRTLPEARLVKWVSGMVIFAYVATLAVISGHCRPASKLWQVYPYPGDDCSQNTSKYYALVITNVFTDLIIMYIPIPLLWKLQTSLRQKFEFSIMFCAGSFIILCTLLRCIICLHSPERLDLGLSWSIRETVVGIIAANAPSIKPLFIRIRKGSSNQSNPTNLESYSGADSHKLSRLTGTHHKLPDQISIGSEERIIKTNGGAAHTEIFAVDHHSSDDIEQHGDGIQVRTEYRVDDHQY